MDDYITLNEAAEMVPTKPCHGTIWRWCARGIYVRRADEVVRMRFVRIGRKYFTKADWVDEFIHRLTAATLKAHEHWLAGSPGLRRDRLRQLAEADDILNRAGI